MIESEFEHSKCQGSTFMDPSYITVVKQGRLDGSEHARSPVGLPASGKSISVLMQWH